jgi:hypothetical protein
MLEQRENASYSRSVNAFRYWNKLEQQEKSSYGMSVNVSKQWNMFKL